MKVAVFVLASGVLCFLVGAGFYQSTQTYHSLEVGGLFGLGLTNMALGLAVLFKA